MSSRSAAAGKIAPRTMARTRPSTIGSHRSEEHTSELQSQSNLVCRLLLEKKKIYNIMALYFHNTILISLSTPFQFYTRSFCACVSTKATLTFLLTHKNICDNNYVHMSICN